MGNNASVNYNSVNVFCPNCSTKNVMIVKRDNAFKKCSCGEVLRFTRWANGKSQCCGYIQEIIKETK